MPAADPAAFLVRGKRPICFCRKFEERLAFFTREIAVDIYGSNKEISKGVVSRPFLGEAGKINDRICSKEQSFG